MIVNEVDKFRADFFEKVIKEEKENKQALQLAQSRCFHQYDTILAHYQSGKDMYQERMCSKCNHADIRSVKVWEGTKLGKCAIM